MSVVAAWREGLRRVVRAPWLIAGVWMSTVVIALPLSVVLQRALRTHLGASLAAESAARGVNFDWWNEFLAQAGGLAATFVPSILGFAAVLRNISTIADAQGPPLVITAAVAAHLLLSLFLLGGVFDRLARNRATGSFGFFGACGAYFFRLLRLAAAAGAMYAMLFLWVHPWLFERLYDAAVEDLAVERTAFLYRATLYIVFALLLAAVNLLVDYAKIRIVVEDRRSVIGALAASGRFVWRAPAGTAGLYALNTLGFLVLIAIYAVVAPGASGGLRAVAGLALAQGYLVLRVGARLVFAASQIALFQGRLAHSGYVAAPPARWPDSAAADAIRAG